jgi:hypothetical protein
MLDMFLGLFYCKMYMDGEEEDNNTVLLEKKYIVSKIV